jgi:hypothetical protein
VYNLGNSKPVLSSTFLETLEGIMGKKARVKYEISLADMPMTYANSSLAHQNLNFVAKTSIQEGLQKFVDWYRHYEAEVMPCDSECGFEGMCFKSGWGKSALTSKELTSDCALAVYTVSTQSSIDSLPPAPESTARCNIAFVSAHSTIWKSHKKLVKASSSNKQLLHNNWALVPVDSLSAFNDSRKATRLPKLSPGKFFHSTVQHAIYIDSTNTLIHEPKYYIDKLLADDGKRAVMASVRNPRSSTMFDEFNVVQALASSRRDITHFPKELEHQRRAYEAYQRSVPGLKYDNVFDGGFLVHDLQWSAARTFRCRWYREYQDWADRDQVGGSFVLTKMSHELDSANLGQKMDWIPVVGAKGGGEEKAYVHILPTTNHPANIDNKNALFGYASVKGSGRSRNV